MGKKFHGFEDVKKRESPGFFYFTTPFSLLSLKAKISPHLFTNYQNNSCNFFTN